MAIDLNAIRNRLDSLQTKTTKTDNLWKPKPGKQQVRIVPYVHNPSNPFIGRKSAEIRYENALKQPALVQLDVLRNR